VEKKTPKAKRIRCKSRKESTSRVQQLIPPFSVVNVSFASIQEEADYFRAQYETTVQKVEEIQAESRESEMLMRKLE
jgi:hypothetical protein